MICKESVIPISILWGKSPTQLRPKELLRFTHLPHCPNEYSVEHPVIST